MTALHEYFDGLQRVLGAQDATISGAWTSKRQRRYASEEQVGSGQGPFVERTDWRWEGRFEAATPLVGVALLVQRARCHWVNATHREAMVAKASAAAAYKAEIEEFEKREDQLFDLFASGSIDQPTHKRQLERLRAEKQARFDKLREADVETDSAYLLTAQHVLELAIRAKSLWERRTPMEKRDLLQRVVCNPRLDGRTVRYDLQKPFAILARMNADGDWRPQGDSKILDWVRLCSGGTEWKDLDHLSLRRRAFRAGSGSGIAPSA